MTFQPPDWWHETWVGEWAVESLADEQIAIVTGTTDVAAEAEDARREEWD